ncbi:acyltransferase 3 [Cadophora sp. MPI-SDFR-AT-0126]|nr:acyltransferase 3 [Leotiomycetes sp. MPI-SDFR-AT-0126]
MIIALIPSFVPRWGAEKKAKDGVEDRRLSPTAYLDGLRGIACFIVYLVHFVVNWFPALRNTYGAFPSDHYILQLPILRVLFEGHSAVATFFVISGYAVSYRALSKIHTGDTAGVLETLSSSTFRRCMRLYLPCAVNTFMCMLLRYWDLFTPDPLRWNTIPPQLDTFAAQFWDWWANQKIFMYPFLNVEGDVYSPPYNGHLWTIPLEIRGSFVVYGTVLAVAKLNPGWRMAFLVAWDAYLFYMGKWDLFLFVGGSLLANLDIPRHVRAKADVKKGDGHAESEREVLRIPAPYILFPLSLFLLSFPHIPATLNISWAYRLVPTTFHPNLASPLTTRNRLLGFVKTMNLQALFTNAFAQYLGRISFGFYLMHGPVLFCLGTKILVRAWIGFDADQDLGKYVGWFVIAVLVNTTAIFCAADWFARVVDERSVRWAAMVARFVSRKKMQGVTE